MFVLSGAGPSSDLLDPLVRAVLNPSEVLSGVVPGLPFLRRSLCSFVGYVLTMIPVFIPELSRGTFLAALSSSPSSESFMLKCDGRVLRKYNC